MKDKILWREALLKSYTLNNLLKQAVYKEDVERQAKAMEKGKAEPGDVQQVYEQKQHGKPKHCKYNPQQQGHQVPQAQSKKDSTCSSIEAQ